MGKYVKVGEERDRECREWLVEEGVPMDIVEEVHGKMTEEHYVKMYGDKMLKCKMPSAHRYHREGEYRGHENLRESLKAASEAYHDPVRRALWQERYEAARKEGYKGNLWYYMMGEALKGERA